MSNSSLESQRKQLESLMKRNPVIEVTSNVDVEKKTNHNEDSNKPQKRSFDYSNYIRNKRKQLQLTKTEEIKLKEQEEQEQFKSKEERRRQELEAKTAKKRAVRQKKLLKSKVNNEKKS